MYNNGRIFNYQTIGPCTEKFTKTGRFYTKLTIDGQILRLMCSYNPLKFEDVNVWAAMENNTEYPVANAKIRNLIVNGEELMI